MPTPTNLTNSPLSGADKQLAVNTWKGFKLFASGGLGRKRPRSSTCGRRVRSVTLQTSRVTPEILHTYQAIYMTHAGEICLLSSRFNTHPPTKNSGKGPQHSGNILPNGAPRPSLALANTSRCELLLFYCNPSRKAATLSFFRRAKHPAGLIKAAPKPVDAATVSSRAPIRAENL